MNAVVLLTPLGAVRVPSSFIAERAAWAEAQGDAFWAREAARLRGMLK